MDLPVSAADRTAQLGYEYDSYEKPPQARPLTPPEMPLSSLSTTVSTAVRMVPTMR